MRPTPVIWPPPGGFRVCPTPPPCAVSVAMGKKTPRPLRVSGGGGDEPARLVLPPPSPQKSAGALGKKRSATSRRDEEKTGERGRPPSAAAPPARQPLFATLRTPGTPGRDGGGGENGRRGGFGVAVPPNLGLPAPRRKAEPQPPAAFPLLPSRRLPPGKDLRGGKRGRGPLGRRNRRPPRGASLSVTSPGGVGIPSVPLGWCRRNLLWRVGMSFGPPRFRPTPPKNMMGV